MLRRCGAREGMGEEQSMPGKQGRCLHPLAATVFASAFRAQNIVRPDVGKMNFAN
jgi:hypothetical protein